MCLAIPAQVSELLDDKQQFAIVDVMGVRRRANIELLSDDPPNLGDWVLIHVGFAMSKISAEYAEDQLKLLSMLGEMAETPQEITKNKSQTNSKSQRPNQKTTLQEIPNNGGEICFEHLNLGFVWDLMLEIWCLRMGVVLHFGLIQLKN